MVEKVEKGAEVEEGVVATVVVVVASSLALFVIKMAIMQTSVIMLRPFASILKITSENQTTKQPPMTNRLSVHRRLDYLLEDHAP